MNETKRALIVEAVLRIPEGKVATYGQVARAAGLEGRARLVGRVLRSLPPGSGIPWHRVLGASGRISDRADPEGQRLQRELLEVEGVGFVGDRVDFARHRWPEGLEDDGP